MKNGLTGKKVSMISLPDPTGGSVFKPNKDEGEWMEVVNEYHGEYDLDWIIHCHSDGTEHRRYNVKLVEMIEWE